MLASTGQQARPPRNLFAVYQRGNNRGNAALALEAMSAKPSTMQSSRFRTHLFLQPLTSRAEAIVSTRQAQCPPTSATIMSLGLAALIACLGCSNSDDATNVKSEIGSTLGQGGTTVGGDMSTAVAGSAGSASAGSMEAGNAGSAGAVMTGQADAGSTSGSPAQQPGCTNPSEVGCRTCCIETSFGCAQLGSTEADAGAAIYDTRAPLDQCPVDCQPCATCVQEADTWIESITGSEQYASCTCDGSSSLDPCFSPTSCECACDGFDELASCGVGYD